MITKKTVLILGAGASQPYGYPLGEELRRRICNNITNSHNTETLNYLGFKGGIIKKFRDEFVKNHPSQMGGMIAYDIYSVVLDTTKFHLIYGDF